MVHPLLQEKSSLDVAAIFKAEREYHEAKAQAAKKLSGGGVGGGSVGGGSVGDGSVGGCVSPISPEPRSGNARNARNNARKRRNKELIQSKLLADIVDIRKGISETLNGAIPAIPAVPAIPEMPSTPATTTVSDDIDSLDTMPGAMDKLSSVDAEVKELRQEVQKFSREVVSALAKLEQKLNSLNLGAGQQVAAKAGGESASKSAAPAKDSDDIDLFGSDEEEDDEAKKMREDRVKAYENKKAKKPALVAKSMIILDVKPWDDETDVKEMEAKVRTIVADGLVWGTSKFVEIAYGIKKLQITCVVEDDKISVDWLEEQITGFEDLVQSIDIAAFNKI